MIRRGRGGGLGSGSLGRGLKFGVGMAAGKAVVNRAIGGSNRGGRAQQNATPQTVEVVRVRCTKCSSLNDESAKFCGECGEKF
ncbi:hypothetical protein FWC63_01985 [Candidatus Saccharibacteria bacterium]|nr:hypothetical protein [Candidatus Saccharibacteria bacterium]